MKGRNAGLGSGFQIYLLLEGQLPLALHGVMVEVPQK